MPSHHCLHILSTQNPLLLLQLILTSTLCLSWKTQTQTSQTPVSDSFPWHRIWLISVNESKKWQWHLRPHLLLQPLLRGVQVHLPLLLDGVGTVLLTLFGQSFLSNFTLVLPPLSQMLQQLCLLTLEGDRGRIYSELLPGCACFRFYFSNRIPVIFCPILQNRGPFTVTMSLLSLSL